MADDRSGRLQARLTEIDARPKFLREADDNASWGRPTVVHGGFHQEQADLAAEAQRIRSELEEGSPQD